MVRVTPSRKTVRGLLVMLALVAVPAATLAQESRSPVLRQAQDRTERSRSAVADAAQAGDRDALRALLKQGADVNGSQGDGTTALHWAAMKGDAEMVQMLVTAGANLRATTRLGAYAPLYLAAKGGHSAAVASLLAAGADVDATSATGATPLDDCRGLGRHPHGDDAGGRRIEDRCAGQRQGRDRR